TRKRFRGRGWTRSKYKLLESPDFLCGCVCFISPQGSHALCDGKMARQPDRVSRRRRHMRMYRFALAALVCLAALAPSPLGAQTYPSKPLHLILPYVPGGIIDTAGRNLALRLSESLGVSVVPENRPGAGGIVGADVVARSAPDGYTVLLTDPALVSNPTLQADVPYDLFTGRRAVSIVGSSPAVIVASLTLPVKTFAEFTAYAKANPGKLNFAPAGVGTAPHLAGEMIKLAAGIE